MRFEDQLFLIQTRGLAAEAAWHVAGDCGQAGERGDPMDLESAAGRQRVLLHLRSCGLPRDRVLAWPSWPQVRRLGGLLERAGARLAWRGGPGYPEKLIEGLGEEAPYWVWIAGEAQRLEGPSCAMIGSRQSPPRFLEAARRLGRALAEAGVAVVSGMAAGADTAAHEGARAGRAGTVAVPAMGLLTAGLLNGMRIAECGMRNDSTIRNPQSEIRNQTWVGLDCPDAPFSAGLAIRRNDVIAALGEGLVLVASGLKGGSAYGVRWALRHRRPLFCFEAGAATPPANRILIKEGKAQALGLGESEGVWVETIQQEMRRSAAANGRSGRSRHRGQMDLKFEI